MSNATDKRKRMRSTLKFHQAAVDEKLKVVLVNDFLQLSKILESLKASDPKAFHAMYGLLEANRRCCINNEPVLCRLGA